MTEDTIMFKVKIDPYVDLFLEAGFSDGGLVPLRRSNDYLFMYRSTFREGVWTPELKHYDSHGVYVLLCRQGETLSSSFRDLAKAEYRETEHWPDNRPPSKRPHRVLTAHGFLDDYDDTPTLVAISYAFRHKNIFYAIVQTEESKPEFGDWAYGRMALATSYNGVDYTFVKLNYRPENGIPIDKWKQYGDKYSPFLESIQTSKESLVNPVTGQMSGIASGSGIIVDNILYVFYTRFLNSGLYQEKYSGYPGYGFPSHISKNVTPKPDGSGVIPGSSDAVKAMDKYWRSHFNGVCIASINLDDLDDPDFEKKPNPFRKYYTYPVEGTFDVKFNEVDLKWEYTNTPRFIEEWTNPYRGLSTKIADGTYPHVHYNEYLDRYIMICQGDNQNIRYYDYAPNLILHYTDKGKDPKNLLNWHYWGEIKDVPAPAYYPSIWNEKGDDYIVVGKRGWISFSSIKSGTMHPHQSVIHKRKIEFEDIE